MSKNYILHMVRFKRENYLLSDPARHACGIHLFLVHHLDGHLLHTDITKTSTAWFSIKIFGISFKKGRYFTIFTGA